MNLVSASPCAYAKHDELEGFDAVEHEALGTRLKRIIASEYQPKALTGRTKKLKALVVQ